VIEFNNVEHGYAIAACAGTTFNREYDQVISRSEHGKLLGGVIFSGFTGASTSIHVGSFDKRWINPDMLWVTFDYPFNQLGVVKLVGLVPSSNQTALDFDKRLGFKEEVRVADVFPNADLVVLSMRREDCRWLKLKPRSLAQGVQ
jgi:RimJ/RimL family protein N-acetyltransferase